MNNIYFSQVGLEVKRLRYLKKGMRVDFEIPQNNEKYIKTFRNLKGSLFCTEKEPSFSEVTGPNLRPSRHLSRNSRPTLNPSDNNDG